MARFGFTKKELETLETIERFIREDDYETKVAIKLKISPVTIRTRFCRMRSKYREAEAFIKAYRKWRDSLFKKSGGRFRGL